MKKLCGDCLMVMARSLNEGSLIPVTLRARVRLLEENNDHRLYRFLSVGAQPPAWLMVPQHNVAASAHGWSEEDKAVIDQWLAADGFRAFMLPEQRARFRNPVIDHVGGKLVIRSGKKKVTPLE